MPLFTIFAHTNSAGSGRPTAPSPDFSKLMMRMAAETAADSETAATEKKATKVELKMDAAMDLKEALM